MRSGELLTFGTVWAALSLYVAAECFRALRGGTAAPARWLHSAGGAFFLAHVAAAFHFCHGWSHAAAYDETARQTLERFDVHSGAGLFLNYAFALVWLADASRSWFNPPEQAPRPSRLRWSVRLFFLFMILNGAVVFVEGPRRWFGALLCLVLVRCWWPRRKTPPVPANPPTA